MTVLPRIDQDQSVGPLSIDIPTTIQHPHIWALFSNRAGDNAQVQAVVDALGLPYETRYFDNRRLAIPANLLFGSNYPWSVKSIAPDLTSAWPDLLIAAGTQSEPICQLIEAHAARMGHRVKIVFLGRPWRKPDAYDLIVTTPQYSVPRGPNVLELKLPLHLVSKSTAERVAVEWRDRIAHLPKPYIMVALGGSISRYSFDAYAARRLAHQLNDLARETGGSVLVCGSYRTPSEITQVLARHLTAPSYLYDWRPADTENPYLSWLGLADACVVTGDSMTMLAEACEMNKPVYIFDLGEGRLGMKPGTQKATTTISRDRIWLRSVIRAWMKHLKVRLIERILPRRLVRNTDPIRAYLVASGQAAWLGDAFVAGKVRSGKQPAEIVAMRVRALVAHLSYRAPSRVPAAEMIVLNPESGRHAI